MSAQNSDIFQIDHDVSQLAISPKHFSDLPIIGDQDLLRSLQLMPGISLATNGASGLNIRGGKSSENLVLLDGMTLYHLDHAFGLLSAIHSGTIKDVRLYKSGFPAKFGGRLSGVMELTAKSGSFHKPRLQVGVNQMSGNATLEVPIAGTAALLLSGRRSHSHKLLRTLHRKLLTTPPFLPELSLTSGSLSSQISPDISFFDFMGKLTVAPSAHDIFSASLYLASDGVSGEQHLPGFAFEENSNVSSSGLSVKWYRQWHPKFNTTMLLSSSDYATDFGQFTADTTFGAEPEKLQITKAQGRFENDIRNLSLRLDQAWKINSRHEVAFGAIYSQTDLTFLQVFSPPLEKLEQSSKETRWSFYAQDDWRVSDKLSASLGIRGNHHDLTDKVYWAPRLTLRFDASERFLLKGAYGKYHQFLLNFGGEFQNFDIQIPWLMADGDILQPASSRHLVVGGQWRQNGYLFDVEVYRKNFDGQVELHNFVEVFDDSSLSIFPFLAQRTGSSKGLDVILKKQKGALTGWLSYSFNDARFTRDTVFDLPAYQSSSSARHNLKLAGNYRKRNLSFAATWQFSSGRPYTVPEALQVTDPAGVFDLLISPDRRNQARLPAATRLDLNVSYHFLSKFVAGKVAVSGFNLLNQKTIWYRNFSIENGQLRSTDVEMFGFIPSLSLELQFN